MTASAQVARSLELVCPLAFFDLETTGADIATDRIVEIAVIKLSPDGTEETLHTLINPGVPIPASAARFTASAMGMCRESLPLGRWQNAWHCS
jgi:DNA polymerase III epsilon subunit-like protein